MFTPSDLLIEAMESNPIERKKIVGALEGYITADPQFETNDFTEAIKYVLEHGISKAELFEDYDASKDAIIKDKNRWDYDYYLHARVYLKRNFCQERVEHVIAIAKKLYPEESEPSLVKTGQDHNNSPQPEKPIGGQQTPGKKAQNPDSEPITPKIRNAKIVGIIIIVVVLLIILIAFIIR